jgi:kumamolisin
MSQGTNPISDHAITDSERYVLPGARQVGPADPDERLRVTVYARRDPGAPDLPDPGEIGARPPYRGRHLSYDDFIAAYRASGDDLDRVVTFAQLDGLQVGDRDDERLERLVSQMRRASPVRSGN